MKQALPLPGPAFSLGGPAGAQGTPSLATFVTPPPWLHVAQAGLAKSGSVVPLWGHMWHKVLLVYQLDQQYLYHRP